MIFRYITLIATLAVLAFCSVSNSQLLASLWAYDKAVHIVVYAVLTVVFSWFFLEKPPLSIAVKLFAFSVFLEVIQPIFKRSADFADVGANAVGIFLIGYFFTQLIHSQLFMKKIFTILFVIFSTILASAQVMPVTIKSFTATQKGASVQLDWTTDAEKDANYFVIERGETPSVFSELARIACNNKPSTYQLTDDAPLSNGAYYRLIQFDLDGKSEVFKSVYVEGNETAGLLYGNIVSTFLYLTTTADVVIFDTLGRAVAIGKAVSEIRTNELPNGIYIARITKGRKTVTAKFLKN